MDPLLDYYLCCKGGETVMVAAYWWDEAALAEYDDVQKLPYWQAMQLTLALLELERLPAQVPDLFPLADFMSADEDRIAALLDDDMSG